MTVIMDANLKCRQNYCIKFYKTIKAETIFEEIHCLVKVSGTEDNSRRELD